MPTTTFNRQTPHSAENSACTILKMNITESSITQLFNGITTTPDQASGERTIHVIDKGNCIEFILPQGTAQFAEMTIFDTTGKPVWKTQTFNNNIIVWPKQTTIGSRVPQGTYAFQLKHGNQQVEGRAMIA